MYRQDVRKIKSILRKAKSATNVFDALEILYFRVTNRKERKYDELYDEDKILEKKPFLSITKKYKDETQVIIDFITFGEKKELMILFYGYVKYKQDTLCFYIKRS